MTSFIKQKTATFSRPRIIVKYMDTLLTSKPLTTATPVDGYAIVDGDIVLFTNLSAINYTIHRATVTGVNITWTQLALGQSADGLPALGDEVFIQAGTYTKKIYWYDGVSFIEFKSGGGIGDSSIFGYLNSQDDNVTTQPFTTGNNATFLTAGTFIGSFNQKNETNPLNGKSSYTYTQGATSINDWIASYPITVPLKAKGVTNVTKLSYMYDGGNSDILPVVYDVTNSKILSSSTKYLENTNGVTKRCELVYDVPSTCSSIKIGFHVKVTNNEKILKFDDIETGVWTPQAVNLVETQTYELPITTVGITYTGNLLASPVAYKTSGSGLFIKDTSVTQIRLKALKKIIMSGSVSLSGASGNYAIINKNGVQNQYGNLVSATGIGQASFSLELAAGDYIEFERLSPNTSYASYSITATAISENITQLWNPSDRIGETIYLPQNVAPKGFISAMGSSIGKTSGTYQGDTYYNLYKVLWNVALNTAGQPYYLSSAKGTDALTDWNAGKTITIDESGLFTRAFKTGVTNDIGQKQDDAFQGHTHSTPYRQTTGTTGTYGLGGGTTLAATTGEATTDGTNGTPRVASETRPVNVAKYVFIRYATSEPTVLALPVATQTEYVLEVNGNTSQSVANTTAIPFVNIATNKNMNWNGTSASVPIGGMYKISGSILTSNSGVWGIGVYVNGSHRKSFWNASGTSTVVSFSGEIYLNPNDIIDVRQNSTALAMTLNPSTTSHWLSITRINGKNDSVFVGNVAKNQVAIVQYRGNGTRTTLSTTPVAMPLTVVKGDTQIVSIASNQFTLQPGEYEINWDCLMFHNASDHWGMTYLYSISTSQEVDRGTATYAINSTGNTYNKSTGITKITLSSTSVFELRAMYFSGSTGNIFLGDTNASPNDLNGFIKITKLLGV